MADETNEKFGRRASDGERLSKLEQAVEGLESGFKHVLDELRGLRIDLTKSQRTPWGTLGTWAGVVLTAAGLIGGLVAYGLNGKIDYLLENQQAHAEIEAHPGQLRNQGENEQRIHHLEKSIEQLDTVLQREMRLLDSETDTRVEQLDRMLQREMDLKDQIQYWKIKAEALE